MRTPLDNQTNLEPGLTRRAFLRLLKGGGQHANIPERAEGKECFFQNAHGGGRGFSVRGRGSVFYQIAFITANFLLCFTPSYSHKQV